MAIKVTRYLPPGSYITEEVVKPIPAFIGLPRQICVIGEGDHCKTNPDERHLRAYIDEEAVTPDNVTKAFFPVKQTDGKKSSMFLFKNGDQQADDSFSIETDVKPDAAAAALVTIAAPGALTAGAPTPGGSVDDGTHDYKVTFVTATGETDGGTLSNTVNTGGGFNTVPLTNIPVSPSSLVTSRKIYRSEAGNAGSGPWKLLTTIANNTTTVYTDTTDDASLTTTIPSTNTAAAGSVEDGTHSYVVTFILHGTETNAGDISNVVTVVDQTLQGQIELTDIPVGPTGTTARKIYRTTAGDVTPYKLVTTIANNFTTTYIDNIADGALTTNAPDAATGLTKVTIADEVFDVTADFTFSYQSLASLNDLDVLLQDVNDDCGQIMFVGSFPGVKNFVQGDDYQIDKPNNSIQWLPAAAAVLLGSEAETFDLSGVDHTLKITIDGGAEQVVTFSSTDGVDFVSASAATAAEVATKISTDLAGFATAADNGGQVEITTLSTGPDASITIGSGTANSALGFTAGQLATGTGKNPAEGEEFFVTYKSVRPDDEFNRPILSTSFDQFIARVGNISSSNALALGGQIIFEQSPPFVYHIQVKNTGTGASAQDIDYIEAIKGAELNPDLTDIVVLGHPTAFGGGKKPLVRAALREHVIDSSSLQNKAERLGWFGMPIGTTVGDGETPGTFVFVATQELQVSADSPGRGRFVLCAPSFVKKTYRFPDGAAKQVTLDSTYLAAGVAALNASFLSPAEGLLRKEVVGFDEVELLTIGDRDFLAQNGVNVVQSRAGRNVIFDPTATDQSSAEFKEINVMAQKDNIVKRVRKSTDDTLIGIVPDDLAQFIFELKTVVALQLTSAVAEGAIANFQNDDGTVRNIDLQNDIIVKRRVNDPTAYDFRFSFYVKFIVKRLFGTFSVVIPSGV